MVYIGAARRHAADGKTVIEVDVDGETTRTMWFRMPTTVDPSPEAVADALFPLGLLMAMSTDGVLTLETPVSRHLLDKADQIQDILLSWHSHKLSRAQLDVQPREANSIRRAPGVVACFTGGVDSFYTLLKRRDEITSLVYVHGFDISLAKQELYDVTAAHLRAVADDVGVDLIEMSSNLKSFLPQLPWATIVHGPALASIGMMLSGEHGTFLIPATHTYSELYRWGSHPLLDPMWSTERVSIVHDGAEATRVRKTVALVQSPTAQQHLRVCWQNTGAYNCGVCKKCYRTKIALRLAGALDKFETFDQVIDPEVVRETPVLNATDLSFITENRDFAREVGDTEIEEALNDAIKASKFAVSRGGKLEAENRRLRAEVATLRSRKSVRLANRVSDVLASARRRIRP